jgi:hypothetical protein
MSGHQQQTGRKPMDHNAISLHDSWRSTCSCCSTSSSLMSPPPPPPAHMWAHKPFVCWAVGRQPTSHVAVSTTAREAPATTFLHTHPHDQPINSCTQTRSHERNEHLSPCREHQTGTPDTLSSASSTPCITNTAAMQPSANADSRQRC